MDSQAMTITKVKNIFIMLLNAISSENIDMVSHFLDDGLIERYRLIIQNNQKKNLRQNYDQPNITNVEIIEETDGVLVVSATIKFIDYLTDISTNAVVSGNSYDRVQKNVAMRFKKNNIPNQISFTCPYCGAPLNINETSICEFCLRPIDKRFSSLVLEEIML